MSFLKIEEGRTFEKIHNFVDFLCEERDLSILPKELKIIGTISKIDTLEEFRVTLKQSGFKFDAEYGNLLCISKEVRGEESIFYVFYDDINNVHLFFTLETKTYDIPATVTKYIERTRNITHLWIGPETMRKIKDELLSKYENAKILEFIGKRLPYYKTMAAYRPEIERSIRYKGRDGKETLEELEHYYGILPNIIEYELPTGLSFRLDSTGIVTLKRGSFRDVFKILEDDVIGKIIEVRDAVSHSKYSITGIKTSGGKTFNRPIQTPWSIKLETPLDYPTAKKALTKLTEDWNFTLFDELLVEGSVYLSAGVIDNNKNTSFEINTTGDTINLYPIDEVDFGSAIRFYAFVLYNIDQEAKPIINGV